MNIANNEYQYTAKNFQFLRKKIFELAGIKLADSKTALVYSRVSRLLRQYHFIDFDEYCNCLKQGDPQIEHEFINAITTNYTAFMRESHHFEYLRDKMLPTIIERNTKSKRIRIWSAGCSTGEEPYSISIVLHDFLADLNNWDVKILATDIDSEVLATAKRGTYKQSDIDQMPDYYLKRVPKYFIMNTDGKSGIIKDQLKKIIYFKLFNLMCNDEWPMNGPFDIIFCRNVMIYFDRDSQNSIINHLTNLLSFNGYLILGHSESVYSLSQNQLKYVDKTIYQRIK
jgi:chemotaxis protein methyltransferase CheR